MSNLALLRAHAERVRRAILELPPGHRTPLVRTFPHGAGGDASLLLGAYLADQGYAGFEYIVGSRGSKREDTWTSHAWLRRGQCVIDITADQFHDAPEAVIVAVPSGWHDTFQVVDQPQPADFRQYTGPGLLHVMYARMCEILPPI